MYYDAHTHLNSEQLFPSREEHLKNFIYAGGQKLVNVGVNHPWNKKAIEMAKKTSNCLATIGIHP